MRKFCVLFVIALSISWNIHAQKDSLGVQSDSLEEYFDMDLEQLRSVKATGVSSELETFINSLITVASQKALSARESPSAITLISEEEIKKSGARDLVDVLRLVPGFDFAYDGSNSTGIGVRGNWANEGKVLLQIDGLQVNEIFSGGIQFGNNIPISSIKRIEIIRGPGSAIYGGFAELGVINIITKSASDINGVYMDGTYGQMKDGNARRTFNIGAGKKVNDLEFSVTGIVGQGNRSDHNIFVKDMTLEPSSTTGSYRTLANNSATDPFMWNLKVAYKGLSVRAIYDNYTTAVLSIADQSGKHMLSRYSNAFAGEVKYDWKVNDKLTITPSFFITRQSPGVSNLPDSITLIQEEGQRFRNAVTANYDFSRKTNLVIGLSYFKDVGTNDADSITTVNGYVRSLSYHNLAGFGQFTAQHRIANLVLGARYEYNSEFGGAFVPRIALTKHIDQLHFKLLYGKSFRSPTIQNIARGTKSGSISEPGISPEFTTVAEIEVGYQLSRDVMATVNIFDSQIKDPIVYISDLNVYTNLEKTGSRGVEFEARMRKTWGFFNINYSFYTTTSNRLQVYTTQQYVEGDSLEPTGGEANKNVLLAFPAHKVTLSGNIAVSKSLSFSPSFVWVSKRYGYDFRKTTTDSYEIYLREDAPKITSNVFMNWTTPIRGLEAGAGIYNIFNTQYDYMVPVVSRSASPLPSGSREYSLRLSYSLKSKR